MVGTLKYSLSHSIRFLPVEIIYFKFKLCHTNNIEFLFRDELVVSDKEQRKQLEDDTKSSDDDKS